MKRKCKYCGEKYEPKFNSLEPCPKKECKVLFFSDNQAKIIARAKKQAEKQDKLAKKEAKDSMKSYSQRVAEAKVIFQRWIRKRDNGKPCISCGSTKSTVWDAGHYKKAELYSGVIFNELNTNLQCGKCNRYLGGNELNYRIGLIKKIGEEAVKELEELAQKTMRYKWSDEELIEIKKKYK